MKLISLNRITNAIFKSIRLIFEIPWNTGIKVLPEAVLSVRKFSKGAWSLLILEAVSPLRTLASFLLPARGISGLSLSLSLPSLLSTPSPYLSLIPLPLSLPIARDISLSRTRNIQVASLLAECTAIYRGIKTSAEGEVVSAFIPIIRVSYVLYNYCECNLWAFTSFGNEK